MLGFGYHSPRAAPTVPRLVHEILEHSRWLPSSRAFLASLLQLLLDLSFQPLILSLSKYIVDAVLLAPTHYRLHPEGAVSPYHYAHPRPSLPHLADYRSQLFHHPRCVSVIGFPQPCAQQKISTEYVQRQIAVTPVIRVKESSLLMAVYQIIGRVQI